MMITPSGYIAHRAMFDRIGRYLYPDDWLGNLEYTARDGLVSIEQYEIDCKTPGRGATGSGSGPRVIFMPDKRYDPAAIMSEAYQAERRARERYVRVHREFLERLESGEIAAFTLNRKTGLIGIVPRRLWLTSRAGSFIAGGRTPTGELIFKASQQALPRESSSGLVSRPRGRVPKQREKVLAKMRLMDWNVLIKMKQEAMAELFGASRKTCRNAREHLAKELLGNRTQISDN